MSTHNLSTHNLSTHTPQCSVYTKGMSAGYRHDSRFEYRHLQSPFMGVNQSKIMNTVKDDTTKFYGYQERPQIMRKRILPIDQFMERPLYAPNRKCNSATLNSDNIFIRIPNIPNNYLTDRPITQHKTKKSVVVPLQMTPLPKRNGVTLQSVPSRSAYSREHIMYR